MKEPRSSRRVYASLCDLGYQHEKLKHQFNYVDPETQTLKGVIKRQSPAYEGYERRSWEKLQQNLFMAFLRDLKALYRD